MDYCLKNIKRHERRKRTTSHWDDFILIHCMYHNDYRFVNYLGNYKPGEVKLLFALFRLTPYWERAKAAFINIE